MLLQLKQTIEEKKKCQKTSENKFILALLTRSKNGTLGRNDTRIVAAQFGVHIRSVQRLWQRGKHQLAHNIPVVVASKKEWRNGSTSLKNPRNITCYPRKMTPIALVKTRITSLGSCSCVFVLGQGLGMESVFLMEK